ncbi:MAG TPA: TetR/AcrR family transcriptional regulator [Gemmatimonadales bacterium]|nr:TetR/AcrR family transcriptional regulator [Gemmatimonadales bacterium]
MKQHPKRSGDIRERLLDAARELFVRQGYDATSVRDITTRAGANLGAITYHFGSKEALYHSVLASVARPLADRVAAAGKSAEGPLDRIEAIVRAFVEHVTTQPDAPSLLVRELPNRRPLPPPLAETMKRNMGAIMDAIVAGQRDGSVRAGDPLLLTLAVASQPFFVGVAGRVLREVGGLDPRDPANRERVAHHAAQAARAAVANPTVT